MTDAEIYARLTEIFEDTLGIPGIVLRPDMTAADVEGWDSIHMINIIVAIELRFGLKFRSREIDKLDSVGDLVALIPAKSGSGH